MTEEEKKEFLQMYKPSAEQIDKCAKIAQLRSQVINKSVKDWPQFKIEWDLDPANYRFTFDGLSKDTYTITYTNGLIIGEADFSDIQSVMAKFSKRTENEIWTVGDQDSIVGCIAHWIDGNKMTPPFIELTADEKELQISGGNHRYAVCVAKKVQKFTFLASPEQKKTISNLLASVKWL